jgi:hypothetical protein
LIDGRASAVAWVGCPSIPTFSGILRASMSSTHLFEASEHRDPGNDRALDALEKTVPEKD